MGRIGLLSPLRHRPFRLLFSGQVISDLGDWLNVLAILVLIVYRWHLGAAALAAFTVTMFLPIALIGPISGVWVDRWPRRTTMVVCDLTRAVLVLGLVWAPNLYVLLALVASTSTVSTFFSPARQAAIRSTVPDEDLLAANSLSQLSVQATKVIGPALGGVFVAIGGPHAAFFGDSASFLASAAILIRLPRLGVLAPAEQPGAAADSHFWRQFRAGFVYIFHRRALTIAVSSVAMAAFIIFTFDALGTLALKDLGLGPTLLGLAVGGVGLGTAVGAVAIGQWGRRWHPFKIMGTGDVVAGAMVAIIGAGVIIHANGASAGWIVVWLIAGLGAAAMIVPYGYVLQRETEPALMGRVAATANGLQTTCQMIAPLIGAAIATWLGVGVVFAASGIGLAALGIVVLLIQLRTESAAGKTRAAVPAVGLDTEAGVP